MAGLVVALALALACTPPVTAPRAANDCRRAGGDLQRVYLNAGWWCDEATGQWQKGRPI